MCGIIYYKSFTGRAVNRQVLKHYLKQKGRGHEGFGFIGISQKRLRIFRSTHEKGIRYYLKEYPFSEILFHHRLPTSTSNTIRTTHPIVVSQPVYRHKYYLAHNGIIYNDAELKMKHEEMGIDYMTPQWSECRSFWGTAQERYEFNDSEALAHEVALFLEGKQKRIEAQGDMTFMCLETDRYNSALRLHFARNNGSPLEIRRDSQLLVIASENVSHQDIPQHRLHTYDYRTQKLTQRKIELPDYRLFGNVSFHPYNWDQLDEIEMSIQEYEEELNRIEDAQLRASARGDTVKYQRLRRNKDQLEEQIGQLYEEWDYLKSICLDW